MVSHLEPFIFTSFFDFFQQPQMITMSVTGLFQELGPEENQPLRSFNRVFVIVPHGVGFCINNEQMFVTNPMEEQRKVSICFNKNL
jgi:hypothetical protein